MRRTGLVLAWVVLLVASTSAHVDALRQPQPAPGDYAPGRVLVGYEKHARAAVVRAIRERGAISANGSSAGSFLIVRVPDSVPLWVERLRALPGVRYAEPDYLLRPTDTVPNDPSWGSLWGLQQIGMPVAWDTTTGDPSVVVGVIDTGIDLSHPDLVKRRWTNPGEIPGNGIDDEGDGWVDDVHGADCANHDGDPSDDDGHGTHVSGTIGAAGNDGIGVVGVNWDVRLMALKIFDANGSATTSEITTCIDYAIAHGVRVTNNSYGGSSWSQTLYDAFSRARNAGVLMVAAAGNDAADADVVPLYPAAFDLDNIVSVAASGHDDALASFSNYGPASVDLAAPGVDILSTVPGGYAVFQGTSMATPHVVGAAALLLSLYPNASYPWLRDTLLSTVAPVPALAGKIASGGRLDVAAAVGVVPSAGPPVAAPPGATIAVARVAGTTGMTVVLRWSATDVDRIASYSLQRSTDGGATYGTVALSPSTATTKTIWCAVDSPSYLFRVRATDAVDGAGAWATAPPFRVRVIQESAPSVTYAGAWTSIASSGELGGSVRGASTSGATATVAVPSGRRAFALVLPRGPSRGKAEIWVDGSRRATLDLYRATQQDRWLAFGGSLDPASSHVVAVRVLGLKRPVSTGARVDLDAIVLLGS